MTSKWCRLLLAVVTVAAVPQTAGAATITVAAGGDLHAALVNARPGDTIELARGATFTGNFTLPNKDGADFITIRTAGAETVPEGRRMKPEASDPLAKLRSPNALPVIQTAPGAHHWRLVLLELEGTNAQGGNDDLVLIGSITAAQNTLAQVPHDIVIDRCYIHGDSAAGTKRCVALNSATSTVTNSYISDCKRIGQDAQAIGAYNGPGPLTITNNYLEASGENILIGGVDPAIPNLVPSDIKISGNLLSKPVAWRNEKWSVKNLLELKNGRRVTIDHNVLQYNWVSSQQGFAVLFTVRNADGGCPWCQVEQVTFEHNILQHSSAGVSILGYDDNNPSQQTRSITIRNNLFADIDEEHWSGSGYAFMIGGQPRDIVIDHNTIIQDKAHGVLLVYGPPVLGFTFTNNVARNNSYGIFGDNHAPGNDSISAYFPGSNIASNVIADADPARYPRNNRFPSSAEFRAQFVSYDSGDYRLTQASSWRHAASDGQDLGADTSALPGPVRRFEPAR